MCLKNLLVVTAKMFMTITKRQFVDNKDLFIMFLDISQLGKTHFWVSRAQPLKRRNTVLRPKWIFHEIEEISFCLLVYF